MSPRCEKTLSRKFPYDNLQLGIFPYYFLCALQPQVFDLPRRGPHALDRSTLLDDLLSLGPILQGLHQAVTQRGHGGWAPGSDLLGRLPCLQALAANKVEDGVLTR